MCHVRPSEEQQLIINYSCLLPVKIFITRALVLLPELLWTSVLCDRITIWTLGSMELDHRITIWTVGNIGQTNVLLSELLATLQPVHGTVALTLRSIECNHRITKWTLGIMELRDRITVWNVGNTQDRPYRSATVFEGGTITRNLYFETLTEWNLKTHA